MGAGRPGWHIECSVMAMKYLGETLDIHAGGIDLTFPHHENEIAQSEALTGKQFARYWMHSEHLIVEGQKMSKSLGNFYTLRDLLEQGYKPEAIRYLLASVPYRNKLNFTMEGLKAAATSIDRLRSFQLRLDTEKFAAGENESIDQRTTNALQRFDASLDDDLNTAEALAAIFEYIRETNSSMDAGDFKGSNLAGAKQLFARFDSIFDVLKPSVEEGGITRSRNRCPNCRTQSGEEGERFQTLGRDSQRVARSWRRDRRHQRRSSVEAEMKIESKAVHVGDRKKPGTGIPSATPIYGATTFFYENTEQLDKVFGEEEEGHSYSRYGNPTNEALEELVTSLENGTTTLACASGMTALHVAITVALIDRRKSVLMANAIYGATVRLADAGAGALWRRVAPRRYLRSRCGQGCDR